MPVQTSSRSLGVPMPSLMSVFGEDQNAQSITQYSGQNERKDSLGRDEVYRSPNSLNSPFPVFHQQRDSTSTSTSESSESSPTTTVSTMDSSTITDPSPSASPESPASNFSPTYSMDTSRLVESENPKLPPQQGPFFDMQRPTTPAKKARNLKNLAVNTTTAFNLGRGVSTAQIPLAGNAPPIQERTSAPASPSFVKPPTPPRRKLSNLGLTIMTPANSTVPRLAIPPTPSMKRPNMLRHFQSSPSLPLVTPSFAPEGGMQFPRVPKPAPLGFAEIPMEDEEDDQEPNFDVPQSREEKPESYPNGPICIYESGVDLFYEPNAEIAAKYDVVMNVASEVKNPFTVAAEAAQIARAAENSQQAPSNTLSPSEEGQSASTPTTPKATPITTHPPPNAFTQTTSQKLPEYIHIPWEHNTDIVPDLYRLVKLIDDRVQQGKRVLVHCQCGVSRSASLIVAYGLYKNPGISVQEAYDAVKKRSKWIGPNMNLIMQLQEFRTGMLRQRNDPNHWKSSSGLTSATTPSDIYNLNSPSAPQTPRTAPLPPEREKDSTDQRMSTGTIPLSAGPVPPAGFWEPGFRRSWGSGQINYELDPSPVAMVKDMPYVDPKGHIVPVLTVVPQEEPTKTAAALHNHDKAEQTKPRSEKYLSMTPNFSRPLSVQPTQSTFPHRDVDHPMPDPTDISDLMSPRAIDFAISPFGGRQSEPVEDFGIMSPVKTDFPKDPFGQSSFDFSRPLPPFSGRSVSNPQPPTSLSPMTLDATPKQKAVSTMPSDTVPPPPPIPESPTKLSTPHRQPRLKAKFSSPNLQEQMRLHKIQTEIESHLPGRSPGKSPRALDDLDALMSPRATEFTKNPFHDVLSVASKMEAKDREETPTDGPVTPEKAAADPRSPVQVGISPITRNIFEVL